MLFSSIQIAKIRISPANHECPTNLGIFWSQIRAMLKEKFIRNPVGFDQKFRYQSQIDVKELDDFHLIYRNSIIWLTTKAYCSVRHMHHKIQFSSFILMYNMRLENKYIACFNPYRQIFGEWHRGFSGNFFQKKNFAALWRHYGRLLRGVTWHQQVTGWWT